jgi:hypothetical protein
MPWASKKQRAYMYANHPEKAREMEKHHPKGEEPPDEAEKKRRKKAAFLAGFYGLLTKAAGSNDLVKRIMEQVEADKIRRAYDLGQSRSIPSRTMADAPSLLPTTTAKSTTRMKLEILRDPMLSDADKNALMAKLEKRPEVSGSRLTDHMQLGAAMPGQAQMAINQYLAAKRNPRASSLLHRILRMGMLSSQALTGDYKFQDVRRAPSSERPSQWKITPL